MSLISGLLAALLGLLGLGPVPTPPIPPVPPGLFNIIGTTTLAPHPDMAKVLAYEQMELSLSDLTVYGTVGGQRVPMWSIELLPIPLTARQPINTPDMLMRWVPEGLKPFNDWTPEISRDDQNNNDGSSQAQSDHEIYG